MEATESGVILSEAKDRLEGRQPVCKDWHAKASLLGVSTHTHTRSHLQTHTHTQTHTNTHTEVLTRTCMWLVIVNIFDTGHLYSSSSGMDGGTLFQLKNLINRRNVTKDPASNVSVCEDFFVEVHILSTFMTAFSMNALDDTPSTDIFTEESTESDSATRRRILLSAIQRVLGEHIDLSINGEKNSDHDRDYVLLYAREVLTLGLFYKEFHFAIREGDGERIITCWRYLLLLFKVSYRTNYSVEAFTLLAQYHFTFSERMQKQLVWSRTVNIHGEMFHVIFTWNT